MIIFRKSFWSNERPCAQFFFGQMTFFVESRFGQMTISEKKIGQMTFLKNELLVKRPSVKRRFGRMNFRSDGIWSNGVRSNGVSVKWPFGQKFSVK
jgi:hypothetical protein